MYLLMIIIIIIYLAGIIQWLSLIIIILITLMYIINSHCIKHLTKLSNYEWIIWPRVITS